MIMVDFNQALQKTLLFEGGYSIDPDDVGGETYKGISRRYHPDWTGWPLIDAAKTDSDSSFPSNLKDIEELQDLIAVLYKQLYWDRIWGNSIPEQSIAEKLFDTSVNLGVKRAVGYLQDGLNLLNRNQKNYNDIVSDGLFGRNTLNALKTYLELDDNEPVYLLKIMGVLQGMQYIEVMRKSPVQEKFARGWLKRA